MISPPNKRKLLSLKVLLLILGSESCGRTNHNMNIVNDYIYKTNNELNV